MIKYIPQYSSYIRAIDRIIPYDTKSIGLHFSSTSALNRLGSELPDIDYSIKSFGSYTIDPKIYNNIMEGIFITDDIYKLLSHQCDFKNADLRYLERLPYIWDLVQFCNVYNLDPISFGIFEDSKLGFWYE